MERKTFYEQSSESRSGLSSADLKLIRQAVAKGWVNGLPAEKRDALAEAVADVGHQYYGAVEPKPARTASSAVHMEDQPRRSGCYWYDGGAGSPRKRSIRSARRAKSRANERDQSRSKAE